MINQTDVQRWQKELEQESKETLIDKLVSHYLHILTLEEIIELKDKRIEELHREVQEAYNEAGEAYREGYSDGLYEGSSQNW
jgi:flagellar biosynthesis/type III secretory pathway protein FliH